jgi:hypothetical protein
MGDMLCIEDWLQSGIDFKRGGYTLHRRLVAKGFNPYSLPPPGGRPSMGLG